MLKFLFTILCTLLFGVNASAQYDSQGDLASQFRPGVMWFYTGLRPAIAEKVRKYDRLVVDLTYNDWNSEIQKPFNNHWASIGLNTSFYFDIPLAKQNTVGLGIGLGHSYTSVRHNNVFSSDTTNNYTLYTIVENPTFKKNSLIGHSVFLPIEIRFRTKGWKHFKVHFGGRVGYQLGLYQKIMWDGENGRIVTRSHDIADAHKLIYGAHIRIGVRNWSVYGAYQFNDIFKSTQSTKLNPFQIGIGISLF